MFGRMNLSRVSENEIIDQGREDSMSRRIVEYDRKDLELESVKRIVKFVDPRYGSFDYHDADDEFVFTSKDKTWALEQTSYIARNLVNATEYEKTILKGKTAERRRVIDGCFDADGDLLAFFGDEMESTREGVLKRILDKDEKCRKRLLIEPSFKTIDLIVTVPENPLFNDKNSIVPLNSQIKNEKVVFNKIILLFVETIYVIDSRTGSYSFVRYNIADKS